MATQLITKEPYRLFFPLGYLSLLWGIMLWLPLLWGSDAYPLLFHRYLVLNGFVACFIAGFLMTAVPRFSKTHWASPLEVLSFLLLFLLGLFPAFFEHESFYFVISLLQPIFILIFMFNRIRKRQENPPFSFVFIFVGLILWIFSALLSLLSDSVNYRALHHEGAIAAIILGVGGRLIPGILGHVEIVKSQREIYEQPTALYKTIPLPFYLCLIFFTTSYLVPEIWGSALRILCVGYIAFRYWLLFKFPRERSALTWSVWLASWMMLLSFLLQLFLLDVPIHASHSFFIGSVVLLTLNVATRVIQSHGPKDKSLENSKVLYWMSFFLIVSMLTRVSAFYMTEAYERHLAYSSLMLMIALVLWGRKYLVFVLK